MKKYGNKSLIMGILGMIFCWLVFGIVFSILGLIFSIKGLGNTIEKKAKIYIGLVLSIVSLILGAFMLVIWAIPVDDQSTNTSASSQEISEIIEEDIDDTEPEETDQEDEVVLSSISATYSGSTEEDITIDTGNSNIAVKAHFSDDTEKDIKKGWEVENAVTLKAGETSTVTIRYDDFTCSFDVVCTTLTEDEYKAQCQEYNYKDVLRNPENYIGQKIKITVKISSVHSESSSMPKYYFAYSNDEYDWWFGDRYGIFDYRSEDDIKLLEDDIINVYGEIADPQETKSLILNSEEVFCIDMKYSELISE